MEPRSLLKLLVLCWYLLAPPKHDTSTYQNIVATILPNVSLLTRLSQPQMFLSAASNQSKQQAREDPIEQPLQIYCGVSHTGNGQHVCYIPMDTAQQSAHNICLYQSCLLQEELG